MEIQTKIAIEKSGSQPRSVEERRAAGAPTIIALESGSRVFRRRVSNIVVHRSCSAAPSRQLQGWGLTIMLRTWPSPHRRDWSMCRKTKSKSEKSLWSGAHRDLRRNLGVRRGALMSSRPTEVKGEKRPSAGLHPADHGCPLRNTMIPPPLPRNRKQFRLGTSRRGVYSRSRPWTRGLKRVALPAADPPDNDRRTEARGEWRADSS
jgi:hypothetical protein